MKLTPRILRATYDRLRLFPPFSRWNLPTGTKIKFSVSAEVDCWAKVGQEPLQVVFSGPRPWSLASLDRTMAHEMIHVRQVILGTLQDKEEKHHNLAFQKMAQSVCREFGFDPEAF